VFGGSDAPPCPPSAGCLPAKIAPLRDGAAYDPRARTWRTIARAPVGVEWSPGAAVIGGTAYVLVPGNPSRPRAPRALLAYSIRRDRWTRLRPPVAKGSEYSLVAAGARLVAYDGGGAAPTRVYDPRTDRWSRLAPDPVSPADARQLVWTGRRLIALACRSEQPLQGGPCLVEAAAYDFGTGTWESLGKSAIHFFGVWARAGDRIVNATLGSSDGGETNGWGRSYPNGGVLHPRSAAWSALPDPPPGEHWQSGSVLAETSACYVAPHGWVLDATRDRWLRIPSLQRGAQIQGRTVVAARRRLFVFGGVRWKRGFDYQLLDDAWSWTPPPPR
jgi:hypothetical protein